MALPFIKPHRYSGLILATRKKDGGVELDRGLTKSEQAELIMKTARALVEALHAKTCDCRLKCPCGNLRSIRGKQKNRG